MKPIRIFDSELNFVAEIKNYQYCLFNRNWYKVGEFELRVSDEVTGVEYLKRNNIIMLGNERNKAGIINYRYITIDETDDNEIWIIKGVTLGGIMSQRVIIPPTGSSHDEITDNVESVMKHYVENNVVNPVDEDRKIDNVVLEINENKGEEIEWRSRYKNLAEELESISKESGIGWDIHLGNGELEFKVLEGKDLRVDNKENNSPVIFSPELRTIATQGYIEDGLGMKNFAYVGGQGEGDNRIIEEVGDDTGIDRKEIFIDARDIDDEALLERRGKDRLRERELNITLEIDVLQKSQFKFEEDYNLGDLVTIKNKKWNIEEAVRVVEVREIYSENGYNIEVKVGKNYPDFLDVLKRDIDEKDIVRFQ